MDGLATHMLTNGFMDGLAVSAACVCGLAQLSCLKSGITCRNSYVQTKLNAIEIPFDLRDCVRTGPLGARFDRFPRRRAVTLVPQSTREQGASSVPL